MSFGPSTENLLWAIGTATAAGATSLTIALPGGAVGTPRVAKISGTVAAYATVNISNTQQVTLTNNPNGPTDTRTLPPKAFPVKTGSVSVTTNLSAAGTVYVEIGFAP